MSAAISAAEKVDGFTRKSVRKAQRQRRSQGSSQFRSHGSQVELSPLPQLKGTSGNPPRVCVCVSRAAPRVPLPRPRAPCPAPVPLPCPRVPLLCPLVPLRPLTELLAVLRTDPAVPTWARFRPVNKPAPCGLPPAPPHPFLSPHTHLSR